MSHISYEEDGEDILMSGEPCPECKSRSTFKNAGFGYWKCEDCSTVWGHDADDPDYDEVDPHSWLLADEPREEDYEVCPTCLNEEDYSVGCPTCGGTGYV